MSGLSTPIVTQIVESLVQLNLIQTDGIGSSIGGRPPHLIHFHSKENYVNGEMMLDKIRKEVMNHALSGVSRSVLIVKAGFGENAALMGSFSLILERILLLESLE